MNNDETSYMESIVADLKKVNGHFGKFKGIDEIEDEEMLEKYAFTDDELNNLLTDVTLLRNKIING